MQLESRTLLVTSMWDCLPPRSKNNAEDRFLELSSKQCSDWVKDGSEVVKFFNNYDSAIEILDRVTNERIQAPVDSSAKGSGNSEFTTGSAYTELCERVANLEKERDMHAAELKLPTTLAQQELTATLTDRLAQIDDLLKQFQEQVETFRGQVKDSTSNSIPPRSNSPTPSLHSHYKLPTTIPEPPSTSPHIASASDSQSVHVSNPTPSTIHTPTVTLPDVGSPAKILRAISPNLDTSMLRSATSPYKNLTFDNPINSPSVSRVHDFEEARDQLVTSMDVYIVVLMGPTGSGKSAFIEAICSKSPEAPLGISKDQLDSVTQEPCIYKVDNVKDHWGYTIYLVDTPGFSDPQISELQVLDQVQKWRDRWYDWVNDGSEIFRFLNTYESAMDIMDKINKVTDPVRDYPPIKGFGEEDTDVNKGPIYAALVDRVANLEQKRDMLIDDLRSPKTQDQQELTTVLSAELAQTEALLKQFTVQLESFRKRYGSTSINPVREPTPEPPLRASRFVKNPEMLRPAPIMIQDRISPLPDVNLSIISRHEPLSVSPVSDQDFADYSSATGYSRVFVLMGPTGSGKSAFIEALCSKSSGGPLGISKDQLESVTQESCVYVVNNLKIDGRYGVYLIDTPGFADPKISEMQVLGQVLRWRDRCNDVGHVRVLYFHPITDIRIPGSRKRCLEMIRGFWGANNAPRTLLVTSMWDRLPERSKKAAEDRFSQLSSKQCSDWVKDGSQIFKFLNTFDSAMDILDSVTNDRPQVLGHDPVIGFGGKDARDGPIYAALVERVASLEQKRDMLMDDLQHPTTQAQQGLTTVLTAELVQTEALLKQFIEQLETFLGQGKSSTLPQNSASSTPSVRSLSLKLPTAIAEPSTDDTSPDRNIVPTSDSQSAPALNPIPSPSKTVTPPDIHVGPQGLPPDDHASRALFIEALATHREEGPLGIAKDQLESVTKTAMMYEVLNVSNAFGNRIYIIDTPGFNDPKISELEVIRLGGTPRFLRDRCATVLQPIRIIYFHPISDIRMPASKKKCIEIMQAFWGASNARTAILVTTLWDRLRPELRGKAEERLEVIGRQYWGDWKSKGSKVMKFENNFESAMTLLNRALASFGSVKQDKLPPAFTPTDDPAVEALRDRLEALYQQLRGTDSELRDPEVYLPESEELKTCLLTRRAEIKVYIQKFGEELASVTPYYNQHHEGESLPLHLPDIPPTPTTPTIPLALDVTEASPNTSHIDEGEATALSESKHAAPTTLHILPDRTPTPKTQRHAKSMKVALSRIVAWISRKRSLEGS
ncbi:hypothetical protein CVT24_008181 [Panaeolus cyanescens]|uniref:G domain-containing protein n=1 Tax=Panaeolus cyanescens TaxID=181874 RepID=A0A409VFK5_9AGAR|nr:hypothetical protein CVT24_008181 [Panaeolus cyanescens]